MREISTQTIVDAVKDASIRANLELGDDVVQALESALEYEESNVGKDILQKLLENAKIARDERIPMCQDTGVAVLFVELGKGDAIPLPERIRVTIRRSLCILTLSPGIHSRSGWCRKGEEAKI